MTIEYKKSTKRELQYLNFKEENIKRWSHFTAKQQTQKLHIVIFYDILVGFASVIQNAENEMDEVSD